jgi:D-alanyl-D-alanine carboxypeptidase (penicillin-binding protein 5/6)
LTGVRRGAGGVALVLACVVLIGAASAPAHAVAPEPPRIPARAWLLLDARDRTRLAAARPGRSFAMASTTKLMTAYLALRKLPLRERLVAPPYSPIPGESLLGLEPGERISVRDLLYGLLLPSGNDAAETLAIGVAGSTSAFVREMNGAARHLGLRETSYSNPIGLDQPGNYSSPHDLASLTLALRRRALFRKIVDTPRASLRTGARPRTVVNRNDLVGEVPWINGVKTGYTPDAGYVLVGSGTRGGVTLLSVVMGAPSIAARDNNTLALLRYGFSLYHREQPIRRGQTLAHTRVESGERGLALIAARPLHATLRRDQRLRVIVDAPSSVPAPVRRGQRIGRATVTVDGDPVGRVPLASRYSVRVAESGSVVAQADDALPGPRSVVWIAALVVVGGAGIAVVRLAVRRGPGGGGRPSAGA